MRTLVVYYSRDGTTRKVGESIAAKLKCDIEEIVDLKKRSGILGYLFAGMDAGMKRMTKIKDAIKDPSGYDLVIVGTPVWAVTVTPAVRTYLAQNKDNLRKVAFYCTYGGSGNRNSFREMESICGKRPAATAEVNTTEVKLKLFDEKVGNFANALSKND